MSQRGGPTWRRACEAARRSVGAPSAEGCDQEQGQRGAGARHVPSLPFTALWLARNE